MEHKQITTKERFIQADMCEIIPLILVVTVWVTINKVHSETKE